MNCRRAPLPDQGVYYEVHACAECGEFIETDEVKVRTDKGWLPYHTTCAPDPAKFQQTGHRIG